AAQCWRDVLLQQIDDPQQIVRLRALGPSPSWRWGCYDSVNATSGDLPSNYLSGDGRKAHIDGPGREEHQAEVPERMKHEDRGEHALASPVAKAREDVDPGGDPEHERAEEQIDREDVHRARGRRPDEEPAQAGRTRSGSVCASASNRRSRVKGLATTRSTDGAVAASSSSAHPVSSS